jgi:hypothetical protein
MQKRCRSFTKREERRFKNIIRDAVSSVSETRENILPPPHKKN